MVEIKATYKKGDVDKEFVVQYDFGGDEAGAVAKFGADVVYNNFVRSGKITIQAAIRRWAEAGKTQEEISALVEGLKLGVAAERVSDPIAAFTKKFSGLNEAEKAALLDKLTAML